MTTYLITGCGSLGTALINELLKNPNNKIRVLDNSEYALSKIKNDNVRKLYGNITDKDRVRRAVHGIDILIHTAAMKNLEITEYNVSELIKTNVVGTDNVISAAIEAGVPKIIFISSDKAVEPTSIYGASKLMGEHTAINYNQTSAPISRVSIFRSGNFMNSSGNVFETWKTQLEQKQQLTITDLKCMRYFIDTNVAAKTILKCISVMTGSEIFIPDEIIMKEELIIDLAKKFANENSINSKELNIIITGLRNGEKLSEKLFTADESTRKTYNKVLNCYVISNR